MKALTTFRIFLFATAKIFLSSWGKKKNSAAFILAFVIHNSAYLRKLLNSKHPLLRTTLVAETFVQYLERTDRLCRTYWTFEDKTSQVFSNV